MPVAVDVGGTDTNAAMIDDGRVVASIKAPATGDVVFGAMAAIRSVPERTGADAVDMASVMIGTTQFTNAFIEGKKLMKAATFRVSLPSTESLRRVADLPPHLRLAIGGLSYLLDGGFEFGGRKYQALDEEAVAEAARDMARKGITSAAVSRAIEIGAVRPTPHALEAIGPRCFGIDEDLKALKKIAWTCAGRAGRMARPSGEARQHGSCEGRAAVLVKRKGPPCQRRPCLTSGNRRSQLKKRSRKTKRGMSSRRRPRAASWLSDMP